MLTHRTCLSISQQMSDSEIRASLSLCSGFARLRNRTWIAARHNTDTCWACHIVKETLDHVLDGCLSLHGLYVTRHDFILRHIVHKRLPNLVEYELIFEPRIQVTQPHAMTPDLDSPTEGLEYLLCAEPINQG